MRLLLERSKSLHNSYRITLKSSTYPIADDTIGNACLHRNDHDRERASKLVKSSSAQCSMTEYRHCSSQINSDLQMLLLRASITLSMKTKANYETAENKLLEEDECCAVHLHFNHATKGLFPHPCSICGCCDGRNYYSYTSGFLFSIGCAQMHHFNQDSFQNSLPENPIKVQNVLVLIESISFTDLLKKSKKGQFEKHICFSAMEYFEKFVF